ncbi:hypothetical protein P7C70_g6128, partial [Phenoliferia sp. Uapishka_3]
MSEPLRVLSDTACTTSSARRKREATARALAGFLQQTGLLLPGNEESVNLAYQIYSGKDKWLVKPKCTNPECTVCGELLADAFKRSFCRETHVHFIGVWDTVASVGALIPRSLPFAQVSRTLKDLKDEILNSSPCQGGRAISHFRHALSLDEHRAKFEPQLWIPDLPPPVNPCSTPLDQRLKLTNPTDPRIHNLIQINYTDIKELWFAGCHADDGGGQTPTDGDFNPRLSHITLRWMVREAFNAGLCLDTAAVTDSPIYRPFVEAAQALADKGDVASTKKLSDEDEDPLLEALVPLAAKPSDRMRAEALAPRGDALDFAIKPKPEGWISGIHQRFSQRIGTLFWWFLEILPLFRFEWSVEGAVRKWTFWPHLGHGRRLPEHVIFHESVEMRQNAKADDFPPGDGFGVPETHYIPKAQFRRGKDKPYVYDS